MKVLIVGNGGREHAMAWKVAKSKTVSQVFVAPGNAGSALEAKVQNVDISATDIDALLTFAKDNAIDLTIVGPEAPLVIGIVDAFQAAGLHCFGPSKAAAQLEGSKSFTKDFLARHHIPTAAYQTFIAIEPAIEYLRNQSFPIVIKADGLAAGKGVVIAEDFVAAEAAVKDMLEGNRFGEAGHRVVIEEFLVGEEASFMVIADGEDFLPFATSQDHKARDNGDKGPNTGGMGAYSPAPVVTDAVYQTVIEQVIKPTLRGMQAEGNRYTGFLYAGLMIDKQGGVKVLEYNCRLGDPETQPLLMRLNSDLAELCLLALKGELTNTEIDWNPQAALGVVLASGGYPNGYDKGLAINGLDMVLGDKKKVFHAGTKQSGDAIVTDGGRVLCATALGNSILDAQRAAYEVVEGISWQDMYCRTDIGFKGIQS